MNVTPQLAVKKIARPATKTKVAAKALDKAPAKTPVVKKTLTAVTSPKAKPKLVRDSFTIPKDEYLALSELKARMTMLMQPVKKSELLRAGLKVLTVMSDTAIKKALQAVPSIKTGRPSKSKK